MLASISEFLRLAIRGWWGLLSGGAGLIIGFGWDALSPPPDMAWWSKWALTAGLAFMGASFQAFHAVRMQREAQTPGVAKRDWTMGDLLNYLEKYVYIQGSVDKYAIVTEDIRQKARDRDLLIWGRKYDQNAKTSFGPWLLISDTYWTLYTLEKDSCFWEAYSETAPLGTDCISKTMREPIPPPFTPSAFNVSVSPDELFAELMVNSDTARRLYRLPWRRRFKNWLRAKVWDWLHS